ncbi:MAG: gamma carbonic anhydrase family protein [Cyanobacteria bacterium]|nr:gamma carbonic anhydrase family protein [Cyanobacteriota bacterium]
MFYEFQGKTPSIHDSAYIAPGVILVGDVVVDAGASIWFNTVVRGDINSIRIGKMSNIQDACVLHVTHEEGVDIGDRVTVGHSVVIHGCTIESDCLIAMRAVVLDGAIVRKNSIIAAGTVVPPYIEIPENSLVMGIPGKVVRQVTDDDRLRMEKNWQAYVDYSDIYRDGDSFKIVV